jgi:RES domain-containing protein
LTFSAWRIVFEKYKDVAFSGEGAFLFGGRWNSPGKRAVYCAESRALAALEMLIHLDSPALLRRYLLFEIKFDESLMTTLPVASLPADWRSEPLPPSTQALGDRWIAGAESAVLRLPSVVIPLESNYLLNPTHPDFSGVQIHSPQPFDFDPRFKHTR